MTESQITSLPILRPAQDRGSLEKYSLDEVEDSKVPTLPNLTLPNLQSDNPYFVNDLAYTKEEEAKIVRTLDTRLFPWILLTTFVLNMDRANISNAISDNLPADLGFNINVVNTATTVYSVLFACLTPTGALIAKRVGPPRWIPFLMFSWGLVTGAHALITNKSGFITVRAFIAITESGVIPATLVYLAGFYKNTEIGVRLAFFWGTQSIASAVSGLMASGILRLGGIGGLFGWKWLFIIDFIITVIVALCTWFYLPMNAARTKGGLRGFKPWFDERQVQIAVTRIIRDDPAKQRYETMVTWADVKDILTDCSMWGHWMLTISGLTPLVPLGLYFPTVVESFKFSVYASNALAAPPSILSCLMSVTNIWHSDRTRERGFHGAFAATWQFAGWFLLRFLPESTPKGVKYFSACFVASWPYTHPLNIAWMLENTGSVGKHTIASGMIIAAANICGIWGSQIYQAKDSPLFHTGNTINIVFAGCAVCGWLLLKFHYVSKNRRNQMLLAAMTEDERLEEESLALSKGNRSVLFHFKN